MSRSGLRVCQADMGLHPQTVLRDERDQQRIVGQIVQRRDADEELRWHFYFWFDRRLSLPYRSRDGAIRAAHRRWMKRC